LSEARQKEIPFVHFGLGERTLTKRTKKRSRGRSKAMVKLEKPRGSKDAVIGSA